jgi:hypothetical protein
MPDTAFAAQILPWVGAITGTFSLLALAVAWGSYKEKVDSHDRWIRLFLENAVMAAQRQQKVLPGSAFVATPAFIAQIPPDLKASCERVAKLSKLSDDCVVLGNRLLAELKRNQVLDLAQPLVDPEGRVTADFAALLVYIRQQIRVNQVSNGRARRSH